MAGTTPGWLKKAGAILAALAGVIGALAAAAQLVEFIEDRQATPTPSLTAAPTSAPVPTVTLTPTVGPFQFLIFPQQVKVGEDAKITLQAWPGAVCFLEYYTPRDDNKPSTADGLGLVTADSQGNCTWEWHINANTKPGEGRLVISINDIEETHKIEILPGD